MLRQWSVNMRLEAKGRPIPKKVLRDVFRFFATKCENNNSSYYFFYEDGSLGFIACPFANNPFANSFGWFPKEFPYDDPYQNIFKGMKASEFAKILKQMGFLEIVLKKEEN